MTLNGWLKFIVDALLLLECIVLMAWPMLRVLHELSCPPRYRHRLRYLGHGKQAFDRNVFTPDWNPITMEYSERLAR